MKSTILFLLVILSFTSNSQECITYIPNQTTSTGDIESKNGWVLPANNTIRILMILAEVNYDVGSDQCSGGDWQPGQLPPWINTFLDVNTPANGRLTNYFQLASSGNYTVLGDFLKPAAGNGVFTVNNSSILASGSVTLP